MNSRHFCVALLLTLLTLAGCGGGGVGDVSAGGSAGGGGDQIVSAGPLQITAKAGSRPQVSSTASGTVQLFGVSSGTFTSVLAALPKTLSNTFIAFGMNGGVWMTDPGGNSITQVYGQPPFFADCTTSVNALGRVTFHQAVAGIHQIWVVNADGSAPHALTNEAVPHIYPSWTTDNSAVLYCHAVGSNFQIYKVAAAGGVGVSLDDNTTNDLYPTQAQNGTIAFRRTNIQSGFEEIWLMNANGTNKHVVAQSSSTSYDLPAIAPDGAHILCSEVSSGQLVIVTTSDGSIVHITSPPSGAQDRSPNWAPDGNHILFIRTVTGAQSLMEANVDGSQAKSLYTQTSYSMARPSWSPYLANKLFIGSGGTFGAGSNGFILAQNGNAISAFVNTVASSGATVTITRDPNNPLAERIVSTGTLTALQYSNGLFAGATTVPVNSTKQAVVSFDQNGQVSLVLPVGKMTGTFAKSGGSVYTGEFPAVYDGKGQNIAPHGATTVSVGPSGKVLVK